jgi:HD-GYP domain-containing protein (c-di-GMP phosphodiesterase class II)
VDTYDALTTRRVYSKERTPFEALDIIRKKQDGYHGEVYAKLVKMLGRQAEGPQADSSSMNS